MRNKMGFIPAGCRQPNYYRQIFNNWAAVFKIGGAEYHVELVSDRRNRETARGVDILIRGPECRNILYSGISSVRRAMETLEAIIGNGAG